MSKQAVLKVDSTELTLPVFIGSEGEPAIDVRELRSKTGLITFDEKVRDSLSNVGDSVLGNRSHLGAGAICSNLRLDQRPVVVRTPERDYDTGLRKFVERPVQELSLDEVDNLCISRGIPMRAGCRSGASAAPGRPGSTPAPWAPTPPPPPSPVGSDRRATPRRAERRHPGSGRARRSSGSARHNGSGTPA